MAKKYLAVKSPEWKYEKEARIIRSKPRSLKIKKDYIRQICFGLNTPDSDIVLIKESISKYKNKVDLCKIIRTDSDFGITVKEI